MSSNYEVEDGLQFEVLSTDTNLFNGERLGRLSLPNRSTIDTPNFLAITSRGVLPHITPDVLQEMQVQGVHLALEDFIEKSKLGSVPPITKCPTSKTPALHSFTALPNQTLTVLAARRTPAVSSPSGNSNTAISTFTSTGFQNLSSTDYAKYIRTLAPDIAISLADIPTSGTANSSKRIEKMTDRTITWLKELLQSKNSANSAIFAPILPLDAGNQTEYFEYLSDDLCGDFQGLAFYSTNLIPDIPPTTTLAKLPRLSLEVASSPHQILRQVSMGVDLMIIPFITASSDGGIALDFQFPCLPSTSGSDNRNILPLGVNIWSASEPPHAFNTSPISQNCDCYTCTNHSVAYIHHLLSAKEMLAWTLLQIHNHHILTQFFTAIRTSISENRFESDCEGFARRYEPCLPEKTGQGPRSRGYHFRGEGPAQARRNERSWGGLYLLGQEGGE